MSQEDVKERLEKAVANCPRYDRQAFIFVLEALGFTMHKLGRAGRKRHLSGRELAEGLRELAKERFGLMARTVLNGWGVRRTDDLGEIVFALVEAGLMSKRDSDRQEDFHDLYDFEEAFERGVEIEL